MAEATLTIKTSTAVMEHLWILAGTGLFGDDIAECAEQLLRERLREVVRDDLGQTLRRFYSEKEERGG